MSLFSSLGKALRKAAGVILPTVGTGLGGPIGGALGTAIGGQIASSAIKRTSFMPVSAPVVLPGAGAVVPAGGLGDIIRRGGPAAGAAVSNLLPDLGVPGPGVFSQTKPPAGYHLSKRPPYRFVKNRRMNPTNHKAAMRAARRLIAFRKAVMRTEKALRKAVPPAARRAPRRRYLPAPHHHHD